MATITPTVDRKSANKCAVITWAGMTTGDTIVAADLTTIMNAALGSVQFEGTFNGGTTVTMSVSNDGTNYSGLQDTGANNISDTGGSDPIWEISTAARYMLPTIGSGSSDDVNCTVVLWLA